MCWRAEDKKKKLLSSTSRAISDVETNFMLNV